MALTTGDDVEEEPPSECRWKVAAIWAVRVGETKPGRKATMNLRRSVSRASMAVVTQASSHQAPVGVSAPSKPSCSAAAVTCVR